MHGAPGKRRVWREREREREEEKKTEMDLIGLEFLFREKRGMSGGGYALQSIVLNNCKSCLFDEVWSCMQRCVKVIEATSFN